MCLAIPALVVRRLEDEDAVRGKRVVVVDDGPTITHGGMAYGAGFVAAAQAGAGEIVDPWRAAVGRMAELRTAYPHLDKVLPAMGYSAGDLADLEATLNAADADVIVAGTPVDLGRLMKLDKPVVRARYEFAEAGQPRLGDLIGDFLRSRKLLHTGEAAPAAAIED